MDRQAYLQDMRLDGTLKGMKPCFVFLKFNRGKIYNGGLSDYIMSLKDDVLHFQKITHWFKVLKPKEDFDLNTKRFVEYRIITRTTCNALALYDTEGFYIEIWYDKGFRSTYQTEVNIDRIIKELTSKGLKLAKDEQ